MTIGERIKQVRKSQGFTQADFGKRIGISLSGVSMLEKGTNNPSEQTIRAICSEFNVSRAWLETGEGQPYVQTELVPELMHALQKYPALKTLMESAADLMTAADWEALNDFARRWLDRHQARADCPSLPPHCCSADPVPPTQTA